MLEAGMVTPLIVPPVMATALAFCSAIVPRPTKTWSSFQSEGRTTDVSSPSGIVETLLCVTIIGIIEPQ
jgi:hypothetical protein